MQNAADTHANGGGGGGPRGRGRGRPEQQLDTGGTGWHERIQVSIARSRKVKGGNYVQLATVDEDGDPACRTVVFRGFEAVAGGAPALKMITDRRSQKVAHCARRPRAELVWWFQKSSEQFRIKGDLQLVGGDAGDTGLLAARKQTWGNLTDSGREQFFWPPPGALHADGAASAPGDDAAPAGGRDAEGRVLPPPEEFMMVLLRPTSVKYLRLLDNFSQTDTLRRDGPTPEWAVARVNP